jgi:hypothetical protein
MFMLITILACASLGFSLGKMSNGMTSPRGAFNFYIGPLCAIVGALIGAFATIFVGSLGSNILTAAIVGGIAGGVALGFARLLRRFGH